MAKFIVTKEENNIANTENLLLLCEALGVCKNVAYQLGDFNPDIFDSFEENETVTISTELISDYVELSLIGDVSNQEYKVCSLYPGEEGPYWQWVMEYIRDIIVGEFLKREIVYKINDYQPQKFTDLPFTD